MSNHPVTPAAEQPGATSAYPRRRLRPHTAAQAADVSVTTIYRAIASGQLEAVKLSGRTTAISVESFERWLQGTPRTEKELGRV